ncbi:olfactory receptor 52J3-like [Protopterus annectens]|uniref:olfactory receptor 52J3-like n=1 Tax=Protopterus annectens TaxID=7888 RepID=UPI001CFA05C0|nr:olfactory receptor 52J3-like [Protopterus annectens]
MFPWAVNLTTNHSNNQDYDFLLLGLPGLHDSQRLFFAPFFLMFLVSLLGNVTVILVIATEQSLWEPMYYIISILCLTDLIAAFTLLPQLLVILWLGEYSVYCKLCFVQVFFIYFTGIMESSVLVLMSYDRYIAVCNPLRYAAIVTNTFIVKGSLVVIVRSFCVALSTTTFASLLSYCTVSAVHNVYCEPTSIISMACPHTYFTDNIGYFIICLIGIPDITLIGLSYYMILRAALRLKSADAKQKAFSTCSSHVFVMLAFYLPGVLSTLTSIFENKIPAYVRVLLSVLYVASPPFLNPLIYGIKTKQIRQVILKHLRKTYRLWYCMTLFY